MENVARGEMTTITYVYKKKTLYIFKAPKKSKFLNILVLEVGVCWRRRESICKTREIFRDQRLFDVREGVWGGFWGLR